MGTPISPETELDADEDATDTAPAGDDDETQHEHEQAETEPEPEQEASAPASEKEIEKANRALEKEATAHANRVSKIMGEDAQLLVPCARCHPLIPGFHFPPDQVPVDDDQRAAVLASIGMGEDDAPPLREAVGVKMCERCDGYGQLTYPSRNPHVQTQQCPACLGQGYVNAPEPGASVTPIVQPATASTWTPPPVIAACPNCGMAGMEGQPHYCAPAATG